MIDKRGSGVVLASYGRGVLVQSEQAPFIALSRAASSASCAAIGSHGRRRPPATVRRIESIEPRRNLIERIDARGRAEPVAANIDRLAIVVAPEPAPDWFLVDRYWAGAHLKDIETLLIVNKSDLGPTPIQDELATYRALGLGCHEVASLTGTGIAAL